MEDKCHFHTGEKTITYYTALKLLSILWKFHMENEKNLQVQ